MTESSSSQVATTSPEWMDVFFRYVDERQSLYTERLSAAVAIPSISADLPRHLPDIQRMMDWTVAHIERLGGTYELRANPASSSSSQQQQLPPILLASFMTDPLLKTVCVYGHLDVQPAAQSDGWDTDPFVLTEKDGKLYGRGSTDDKGPALSWLWVIEAFQALHIPLPVNVKILYEYVVDFIW
jgi:acetylornithine deacetylase/succinyl-diaminopimelate desuccinylase-like protein